MGMFNKVKRGAKQLFSGNTKSLEKMGASIKSIRGNKKIAVGAQNKMNVVAKNGVDHRNMGTLGNLSAEKQRATKRADSRMKHVKKQSELLRKKNVRQLAVGGAAVVGAGALASRGKKKDEKKKH